MDPMVAERSSSAPSSRRGIIDSIRTVVMMVVVLVVVSGCLFIWVMAPTRIYGRTWLPKIRAQTLSTFFGTQGATILLYTFPTLFIAVLGTLYLHLGKNNFSDVAESSKGDKHKLAGIWRRPVIVKGLGIVSRIELVFFAMFIALLVWSYSSYLRVSFAKITPHSAAANGEQVWESKLDSAALRLGLVGNICLAFLFFPVTRSSSVLPLFGLTSEASVKYHIWIGHITMTLFTAHGVCYVIYWTVTHQISQMVKWDKTGVANVAGEIALLAGLAMWGTTLPRIRRKMFELFFYTHHLYVVFIIFFVFHVGISSSFMMLPGFYLFLVDRFLRFLQSRRGVRLVSARVLPCEAVELNFSKTRGLSYTPTSIMFVNLPGISKMQWHPFTISSSSNLEPEKLSVIIKGEGSWSKKLHHMLSSPNSTVDHLDVSTEGPYGPVSTDFLRHDTIVMVSGGSGITPFISIIRDLIFLTETLKCKAPQILLIAAFKNSSDLTLLDLLLPMSGTPTGFSNLDLQIQAYVTRERGPTTDNRKTHPTTVWFKPKSSDAPISPILGPNSWLWLGAIISSSFVMFLLFLGILTRYYIYPIDNNTNHIYPYSRKAAFSMLFICICIATTASGAFYWDKKKGSMEVNQVQNMEGASPSASPSTWVYNADRELESFPQQSFFQSTNLHYGERPDLKSILLERKESSIGVLVCGPKKMRHEVASICGSGIADNLHFESISFSW